MQAPAFDSQRDDKAAEKQEDQFIDISRADRVGTLNAEQRKHQHGNQARRRDRNRLSQPPRRHQRRRRQQTASFNGHPRRKRHQQNDREQDGTNDKAGAGGSIVSGVRHCC